MPPGTEDLCCGETEKRTEKKKMKTVGLMKV